MSLCMSLMRPFDYEARDKLKKWETDAEMWEKSPLVKAERHFSRVDTSNFLQDVLPENASKNDPRREAYETQGIIAMLKRSESSS